MNKHISGHYCEDWKDNKEFTCPMLLKNGKCDLGRLEPDSTCEARGDDASEN